MGTFFADSWVILVITALILVAGKYLEDKNQMISKHLKMEIKNYYMFVAFIGIVVSIVNFIAVEFFGSWQTMFISVGLLLVIIYGGMYFIKRNNEKK
ncbi:MFS transporter [Erysipelothrix urinaevulpis]|uniref:MFS transporter n=1 Tax=Erysipelothrix urinaevulpis TaxID=2683717 RepID=UPI00135BDC67|nr:MFS transporter [Erysipelothrix urinaevulpis]